MSGIEAKHQRIGKVNRYKPTDSLERWEGRVEMQCRVVGNGLNVGPMRLNVGECRYPMYIGGDDPGQRGPNGPWGASVGRWAAGGTLCA